MDGKRSRTTYALLGGAAALLLFTAVNAPKRWTEATPPKPPLVLDKTPPPPIVQTNNRPKVDVVFALDTTGSMSGLIDGAKKKIWEISRFIAQGQPAPELRVGLIAYRDVGDDYVTRFYDLSDDLDAVYQNLSSFSAAGGGDGPEHVAKALHDAVNRSSWSKDKNTLRIVYLVGDAPPHTDYSDGYNFRALAQRAGESGIRINTIRCGMDQETERFWKEIANRAHGEYASIDQSGGVVDVHTPYDEELAKLNGALSGTAYGYGSAERRRDVRMKAEAAAAAPAMVQAERAGWLGLSKARKGKVAAVSGEGDLIDDVVNNKVSIDGLAKDALPEPMQAMSEGERKSFIESKAKERQALLDKINDVSAKRDAYLKEKTAAAPGTGFDAKVRSSLKRQAADVGLGL